MTRRQMLPRAEVRAGRDEERRGSELPRVSVVIPIRNEERNIAACLDAVLAQADPASGAGNVAPP